MQYNELKIPNTSGPIKSAQTDLRADFVGLCLYKWNKSIKAMCSLLEAVILHQ